MSYKVADERDRCPRRQGRPIHRSGSHPELEEGLPAGSSAQLRGNGKNDPLYIILVVI